MIPIIHHPAYQADILAHHRFPMGKFRRLAECLIAEKIVSSDGFLEPAPAPSGWLSLAHSQSYVDMVLGLTLPDPIQRQIGFPMTQSVVDRARAATGGTILAARMALEHGIALNSAGGSHHARRDQGAGFCVFNDVAVASNLLLADGSVGKILIIDLDVHQGDGTADIFRDDPRVTTLSVHAARNYPTRKIPSTIDVALDDDTGDAAYLDVLDRMLETVIEQSGADVIFYNAGVDPHVDDRLGRLALSDAGLAERDRRVIGRVRDRNLPLVGVIGGGYDNDVGRLVQRHMSLFRAARDMA